MALAVSFVLALCAALLGVRFNRDSFLIKGGRNDSPTEVVTIRVSACVLYIIGAATVLSHFGVWPVWQLPLTAAFGAVLMLPRWYHNRRLAHSRA